MLTIIGGCYLVFNVAADLFIIIVLLFFFII